MRTNGASAQKTGGAPIIMKAAADQSIHPTDRYLTVDQVAHYLSFDRQTIWRWAREGSIPCYRVGNKFRFKLKEIQRWMEDRKQNRRLLHDGRCL